MTTTSETLEKIISSIKSGFEDTLEQAERNYKKNPSEDNKLWLEDSFKKGFVTCLTGMELLSGTIKMQESGKTPDEIKREVLGGILGVDTSDDEDADIWAKATVKCDNKLN